MKIADLSPEAIEKIKSYEYDQILEKHEGPHGWSGVFKYYDPEFIEVNGYDVLLPVERKQHPNITILRCIVGDDGKSLTIFLKDTTYIDLMELEKFAGLERFESGFMAVCDKVPGEEFFLAIVYHEWYLLENRIE